MTDNEKQPFIDRVLDYVLLFWCIVSIVFLLVILQYFNNKNYQNQEPLTNSASAKSVNEISNYDTITDLTGTQWYLNEHIASSPFGWPFDSDDGNSSNISISFNSGYYAFDSIRFADLDMDPYAITYLGLSIIHVYSVSTGWVSDAYRTISIAGGTGATNSTLISWLQSNATRVISGYSSTINLTNCTCNMSSESGLSGSYTATITANTGYYLSSVSTTLGTITYSNNNKVATISISDVTEDFTISATASLIYHNISYNLGNVVVTSNKPTQIDEISTISITFQPFSNYVLPQYINIEGVTSYQWNKDTGVLTLSNAYDNVEISINAEYKSGQYTFVELIDSVTLVPVNTFFNLFNFELLGINIYNLLLSALILFVIIKIILKIFK